MTPVGDYFPHLGVATNSGSRAATITSDMSKTKIHSLLLCLALVAAACTGSDGSDATTASTTTTPTTTTTELIAEEPPVTVEPLPEIDPAPNAPTGLFVIRSGEGAVELEWDASRDETVTGYELTRVSPSGTTEVIPVAVPSYLDLDVVDEEVYTYQLRAIGAGGESEGGEPITVLVGVDTNPPDKPSRPILVETPDGVELTWGEVADFSGIDNYLITRVLNGETSEIDAGAETSYFDDVAPGTIVTYSVRAVDGAGNESIDSRKTTVLAGTPADGVIVVVSAESAPGNTSETARVERELLEAGFTVTWFEDGVFDSNLTTSDDIVLLLGDVQGDGFDWRLFSTDAHIIGLKGSFIQSSGILDTPPKLERLPQLSYQSPGTDARLINVTNIDRPKPVVHIQAIETLPSLEIWASPPSAGDVAVAGLIPEGGEMANENPAPGCRAFFPGNSGSLAEQSNAGWSLLVEFVGAVQAACVDA